MTRRLVSILSVLGIVLLLSAPTRAQITNVTNDQATPIPGVGHNYIQMLSETVNPSNGSVSLRIQTPAPPGRLLNIPFGFDYDTSGVHHFTTTPTGNPTWAVDLTPYSRGGWSYLIPLVTYILGTNVESNGLGGESSSCSYYTGFVFLDPNGTRHALGISQAQPYSAGTCLFPAGATPNAGDDFYRASAPTGWGTPGATVVSANGTVYGFDCPCDASTSGDGLATVHIEDRNGNVATSTSNAQGAYTLTDTLKRPLISTSSFASSSGDTITISGLSTAYVVTWKTETSNFTVPVQFIDGETCTIPPNTDQRTVVSTIKLPNGQSYTFLYGTDDPNNSNPYGLLSKVTYPSGAWVKYAYGINSLSDYFETTLTTSNGMSACAFLFGTPAVTQRTVSFDGTDVALTQTFSYSTSWNSSLWTTKSTTVTTNDMVAGQTFVTDYVYTPITVADVPDVPGNGGTQVPVEQTITYENGNNTVVQKVSKTWQDQYLLKEEQITPGGSTLSSETAYTYGSGGQVTDKKEYDFGGTLLRNTETTYQTFPDTPIYTEGPSIFDRPCQIVVYDGNNNRFAETDYLYDGGTALCGSAGSASTSSAVTPSGTHDETNYGASSSSPRGNATTKTVQCLQSCTNSVTTFTYDETGQELSMKDPCGNNSCADMVGTNHTTTYSYTDSYSTCSGAAPPDGNTNAYLTDITDPLGHTRSFCYGYTDGQVRSGTDPNGQTTTYAYSDSLDRLTRITYPTGGGVTSYSYNDAPPTPSVSMTHNLGFGIGSNTTISVMDGAGHVTQTQLTGDPAGTDYVTTTFNGEGHTNTVTNPYRSGGTQYLTTYTYDALGRTTEVKHPDGKYATTAYSGRDTQATDEGNGTQSVQRISQTDGLGRLLSVCEVSSTTQLGSGGTPSSCGQDISATGFLTTYTYDPLDDLLNVSQGGYRPRTLAYDSLSRLLCAANPEVMSSLATSIPSCPNPYPGTYTTGTIGYAYDANGNLSSKISPEPNQQSSSVTVTTTYAYDVLNRVISKSYSDGVTPTASFVYDACPTGGCPSGVSPQYTIGRVVESSAVHAQTFSSYDTMGRIVEEWQCTPVNCGSTFLPLSYSYDQASDLTSATNGFGVTLSYTYNNATQLTGVTSNLSDANHPATLLSSISYTAASLLSGATLGNGDSEGFGYDTRNRLTGVVLSTSSDSTLYDLQVAYTPDSDVLSASDCEGVLVKTTCINGNWSYGYDALNRLTSSTQTSSSAIFGEVSYTYAYDRFGNRWQQNVTSGSGLTSSLGFTGNNNHIDTYNYDSAGNLLNDGTTAYVYDAENRITTATNSTSGTSTYVYDANGRRVEKSVAGVATDYLYDLSGNQAAMFNSSGTWLRSEIYASGKHLATYTGTGGTTYFDHADWLGTERVRTSVSGAVCETIASLPFGDDQTVSSSCADPSPLHFTGKERDSESNLDNFDMRYYGSSVGRFMSPDPDNISGQMNPDDPQSWNGYSYTRNNPLLYTDPNGETYQICTTDQNGHQQCTTVSDAQFDQAQQSNGQGGLYLKNGGVYYTDQNGNQVQAGTYVQTDVDLSPFAAGALGGAYQRSARAIGYINDAFDAFFLFVAPAATGGEMPDAPPRFGGGQYGTASTVPSLNGMSRSEADSALKGENPTKVHTTAGGYTQYKFADGSQVWIRPDGGVVRVPAPGTAPAGSRVGPEGDLTMSHNTGEKVGR